MLLLKSTAIWLFIMGCAVLNGGFREAVLLPKLGTPLALVLSGILLSVCIVVVTLAFVRWLGPLTSSQCLWLGLFWLCLTLVFEFGFGRLVQHRGWPELLEAYTFKDGNLWPLVLVVIFFAPLLAVRLRPSAPKVDEALPSKPFECDLQANCNSGGPFSSTVRTTEISFTLCSLP